MSWRAIRAAALTARRKFGANHPFATKRMHSDGRSIFFEAQQEAGDSALYDLVADDFAIYDVLVDSFIASVEFEDDQPRRWVPDDRFPRIVIDPKRAFGRPIESTSRTPAEALFDAWRAEKSDAAKVAAYFGSDEEGVKQAVGFTPWRRPCPKQGCVRVIFDENMPKVVAHTVKIIAEAEAGGPGETLEVLHALDLIAKGTPDILLIQAIADGSHSTAVLITTDKSMRTRQHERAAFTETGCIGIVLRQGWNHASMWERARYSLRWWSAWIETARYGTRSEAKPGTLWECPWSQRPKN